MRKVAQDSLFSFSRKYRLVSKQDFQSVFTSQPRKITHKYLLALSCINRQPHARLGIIIGKHLIKHAVKRNQLRRMIRESFRHHKETLKGLDIIVILRSECTPLGKNALRDDIDSLWLRLANLSRTA